MTADVFDGAVLQSPRSTVRFLVVAGGDGASMPTVDGVAMRVGRPRSCSTPTPPATRTSDVRGGTVYTDPHTGLRLLCIESGRGVLECAGRRLVPARRQSRVAQATT